MIYTYKIPFKEGFHSRPAIGLTELSKEYKEYKIIITKVNNMIKNIECHKLIAIVKENIAFNDIIEITVSDLNSSTDRKIKERLDKIFQI